MLRNTQPSIVRALVGLKALPIATRIEIAERGEALAIIEATKLGDLYLEALREGAALPPAVARRARMVAAARNASNPTEMVNSIAAAYGEARGSPLFPTIARASAAALINLPAQPQFANVAQEAMRGFLLLGRQAAGPGLGSPGAERRLEQRAGHHRARPAGAPGGDRGHRRCQAADGRRDQSLVRSDPRRRCRPRAAAWLSVAGVAARHRFRPAAAVDRPARHAAGRGAPGDAGHGQPAGAGQRRRRRSPRRDGIARADRGRRDAAQRASSCRHRGDRAGPAPRWARTIRPACSPWRRRSRTASRP